MKLLNGFLALITAGLGLMVSIACVTFIVYGGILLGLAWLKAAGIQ